MANKLRVFISSPGDVRKARQIVAQTVEKVAPDYLRHFHIEPYLWETEALVASGTFQDAIEPPSGFDIVVLILWSRLGTLLPEQTAVRSYHGLDGRAPVTGTEWEYEDAVRASRARGVPDLLVYRSREQAGIDSWNAQKREDQLKQLGALDVFWARHFADGDTFIGAYHEFVGLDELAATFDNHLRRLIERRIADETQQGAQATPPAWPKAPFRGLEAYDFEHAPIFFGRADAVGKALGQLIGQAEDGHAFLLVLGASGSGKSSLVQAGLAPKLTLPRRVTGKSFQRRMVFRPRELLDQEDLFDALARAMTTARDGHTGVPEFGPAARLSKVLREAPEQSYLFLEAALDRLTEQAHQVGSILLHEQVCVLLIIDQLEEMFTDRRIGQADRLRFVALLGALARGGRVWVVATMRADLWHRASETPDLVALAEGLGRFDLLAPRSAEISQMIRLPAEAAAISFEHDPANGVSLNDQIAEDAASAPGVLPLLSYVLEQMYQADVVDAGGAAMTWATYKALGGLKGAIAARAETILADQSAAVQTSLRSVLFSLVQITSGESGGETISARRAPLEGFAAGSAARRLVDAFLDPHARLLIAELDGRGTPVVRVAHEALLTEWERARKCIADSAIQLQIRRATEARFLRWAGRGTRAAASWSAAFSPDVGLLSGIDLDDARRLLRERRAELDAPLIDFIERSDRQARWRRKAVLTVLSAVAGVMTLLAALAGLAAFAAHRNYERAETQLMDRTLLVNERDADAAMTAHRLSVAIQKYSENVALAASLVRREPNDPHWRFNLANAHAHLGVALAGRGQGDDARRAHAECVVAVGTAAQLAPFDRSQPGLGRSRRLLEGAVKKALNC